MRDLIFVSLENWDEVWRRNQFLCTGLARRFPDRKILFVAPALNVSNALRHGQLQSLRGATQRTRRPADYPNITITQPLKLAPDTLHGGRRCNERMFRAHVRKTARQLQLEAPLLWLNPHSAGHLAGRLGERAVIYDITDDWALASGSKSEKQLIARQDHFLCRRADLTIVCSRALEHSRRRCARRLLLLPNGVDAAHYADVSATPAQTGRPTLSAAWPSPVFGYTGTLHGERIDSELIVALARAFPHGSVVLIGPDFLDAATREKLKSCPNIFLPGPVAYARIGQTMSNFDVCIVPHQETAFTESLNPIKLWEYLACGKPIVSTNIAGFRDYAHLLRIASGATEFVKSCRDALDDGAMGRSARQEEAVRHSWEARLDCLLQELDALKVL